MNWKQAWLNHHFKKHLFNIIHVLINFYVKCFLIYCRLFPKWILQNLFPYSIQKRGRLAAKYLFLRATYCYDTNLLQKSLDLSHQLLKNFRYALLDFSTVEATPSYMALIENGIVVEKIKLRRKLSLLKKSNNKFYVFLPKLTKNLNFFVISENQNVSIPLQFVGNLTQDIELNELYDPKSQRYFPILKQKKIMVESFNHCFDKLSTTINDLDLTAVFTLIGNINHSRRLLQRVSSTHPSYILNLAKQYFNIGDFQACQQLIEKYNKMLDEANGISKVLLIEDPREPKSHSWYNIIDIGPEKKYNFPLPQVFPHRLKQLPHKTLTLHAEQIFHVRNAEVYFGNVVVGNDECLFLYEPGSHPSYDFVARYPSCLYGSHFQIDHCFLHGKYDATVEINSAILIDGRCSENYFHWIVEYLARMYTIQKMPEIAKLPLIVDETIAPASKQILQTLCPNVPIIWNNKRTKLIVRDLYIPSFHTYHPDHMELPFWKISGISHDHLKFIRDAAYQQAKITQTTSRKIYLKRESSLRGLMNVEEIESVLQRYGFEAVDPAKLNFNEQVELFASAKYIVGVGGAAFTNLIFCQPGCVVIGLISKQLEDFCMQSNIGNFAGCEFVYVSGISEISAKTWLRRPNYIHANFAINPRKLEAALKHFLH